MRADERELSFVAGGANGLAESGMQLFHRGERALRPGGFRNPWRMFKQRTDDASEFGSVEIAKLFDGERHYLLKKFQVPSSKFQFSKESVLGNAIYLELQFWNLELSLDEQSRFLQMQRINQPLVGQFQLRNWRKAEE